MITPGKVLAALGAVLGAACPECKIYPDEVPQNFVRPSLYAALMTSAREPITCGTMRVTERYVVYCFTPTDDYGYSAVVDLLALQDRVVTALDAGFLRVDSRAVSITSVAEQPQADYAEVSVSVTYTDARRGEEEEYDLMQIVNTKIGGTSL